MNDLRIVFAFALMVFSAFLFYKRWKHMGNKMVLREFMEQGAIIVDVRDRDEFSGHHFPAAINIPLAELSARLTELGEKNTPIIVYCSSGMRSRRARTKLIEAGFSHVENGVSAANLGALR